MLSVRFFKDKFHAYHGPILLSLTWLIMFSRILSGKYVYFLDDLLAIFYPLEAVYARFQHAWQLPVWSNLFGFGQPLMAWGQLGFFTPVHVLLRALYVPALDLLQTSIMAYFGIGLIGMYLFLRRQDLPQIAAAFGSIIFVFSGFNIGHLNHVNFYTGTMVLPWLLLAVMYFIAKPTVRRAVLVSLAGAVIALSAQPQVMSYGFVIAAIYALAIAITELKKQKFQPLYIVRLTGLSLLAVILALCLSSFALLPLREFLPLTERSDAMSEEELLDFSYVPQHAITLISPYFFGDHDKYWGAKGFQELAAFTGIIPLLLASLAAFTWKSRRALRSTALCLVAVGFVFALGKYSPVYFYLVTHRYFTTFAIPGRFVLFFDTGVALLAALALADLKMITALPARRKISKLVVSLLPILVIFTPFIFYVWPLHQVIKEQFTNPRLALAVLLAISGFILYLAIFIEKFIRIRQYVAGALVLLGALTLLVFAWNYTPVIPRSTAGQPPFAVPLQAYAHTQGTPPRVYSRGGLLNSDTQERILPAEKISPTFSIFQPIQFAQNKPCLTVPMHATDSAQGSIKVSISISLDAKPLETKTILVNDIKSIEDQKICWSNQQIVSGRQYIIAFTSDSDSEVNLYSHEYSGQWQSYWVRAHNPAVPVIEKSKKTRRIIINENFQPPINTELILLTRHTQAAYGASGGRWIGALSIRPYREFIEKFFANDSDALVDGAGQNILQSFRKIFDLAGITHFAQILTSTETDTMPANGFPIAAEYAWGDSKARLYQNPQAYPKAFLIHDAEFIAAADDVRAAMLKPDFNPKLKVYISGDVPPATLAPNTNKPAAGSAAITKYTDTRVDVSVSSPELVWLVINDATTPQWRVLIDNQPAPSFLADSVFKAAQIPAGNHTVSFEYYSPAIELSKKLTLLGLTVSLLLLLPLPRFVKVLRYNRINA